MRTHGNVAIITIINHKFISRQSLLTSVAGEGTTMRENRRQADRDTETETDRHKGTEKLIQRDIGSLPKFIETGTLSIGTRGRTSIMRTLEKMKRNSQRILYGVMKHFYCARSRSMSQGPSSDGAKLQQNVKDLYVVPSAVSGEPSCARVGSTIRRSIINLGHSHAAEK